ncbi:hypothetical protein [Pseudonocardia sp.]|uniref:hypothetical protein n=1 Tax=Pseudonocardia sp. TaxID=60912 RepID=UPI0031FDA902
MTAIGVLGVLHVLPITPISAHADQPLQIGNFQLDEIGWPQMVEDVAAAYRALPAETVRNAIVVTEDYWTVSAIQHFAPDLPSYSTCRPRVQAAESAATRSGVRPSSAAMAMGSM